MVASKRSVTVAVAQQRDKPTSRQFADVKRGIDHLHWFA